MAMVFMSYVEINYVTKIGQRVDQENGCALLYGKSGYYHLMEDSNKLMLS